MEGINVRIDKCIKALKIKKTDFAERLNVTPSFVTLLTNGKSFPSDRTIADICREFNVSEPWLRDGEGEMFVALPDYSEFDFIVTQIQESNDLFIKDLIRSILKTYWTLPENEKTVIRKFVDGIKNNARE